MQRSINLSFSNNYNMKSYHARILHIFQLITEVNLLREDSYLYSKILIIHPDKKVRHQHLRQLIKLEKDRADVQNKLISTIQDQQITQDWKSNLFQLVNKVYKDIKRFHQKIVNFSSRMAQISETNGFLQTLRNMSIERLSDCKFVKDFIITLTSKLRERHNLQLSSLSNTSSLNKIMQIARSSQSNKSNRYFILLKQKEQSMYFQFHRRALLRIQQESLSYNNKAEKEIQLYRQLLDLDHQSNHTYVTQNFIKVKLNFIEEGFCQFITGKYQRIYRDLKTKNSQNLSQLTSFETIYNQHLKRQKYNQSKLQTSIKEILTQTGNISKFSLTKTELKQLSAFKQKQKQRKIIFGSNNSENGEVVEIIKKDNNFKFQKNSRNRSHTLRPLCESKQNNKSVVHQKIIQIKLQESPAQTTKVLRIRKKKMIPIIRQQNGWSLLLKDSNPNKISFFIH